ncbi:hypothetical protein ACFSCW_08350 [Sphingomonas tabacisoli]|uniref:DUF2946 domain-containing protein n=1 Tax=Sphingomonas tabacisoli TaxID=2249466 RepID=A0ABW4I4M5_9SPHN
MSALRHLPARHLPVALLLAFALLARMLVPAGWMPVFDGNTVRLELCTGYALPPPPAVHDMHAMHGGKHDAHAGHGKKAEQPCPFGALAFGATDTTAPSIAPPLAYAEPAIALLARVSIGQGLAAPPPPATGPPALT